MRRPNLTQTTVFVLGKCHKFPDLEAALNYLELRALLVWFVRDFAEEIEKYIK